MAPATDCRFPASPVFYRSLTKRFPKIVCGEGCWIFDDKGKRYLDASGGAFTVNIGHGVREIADAIGHQAGRIAYVNGTAFTSEPTEELAQELVELNPEGLGYSYFLGSGSEAVEAALKLARQYWVETGKPGKHKIISQNPGYHGNTLLALSTSARGHYKKLFEPWLVRVPLIPAPYPYRCPCNGKAACPVCSGSILEKVIEEEGAGTVAAFIAEPIGGSSTGASVPRPDYYRRVREICDRHEVLLIDDEVLTGAGRTGKWVGIEHFGVVPDIMVLGKGLSGGYVPLSAVVTSERIIGPLAKGSGKLLHAQTFSHTPTSCAAGLAAVRYIKKHSLVAMAAKTGKALQRHLSVLRSLHGVGDVRGIGMLHAVEFVADAKKKTPHPRELKFAETFVEFAQDNGLVVWPNVGHADGVNGDLVMIAPPFTITEEEIRQLVSLFENALDKTLDHLAEKS
ncbi:MAG: aminotransferase class III-fold pyridoxal phosphate-dependent enzyme [Elusimicrobia bacterium]|nr:aminotransferase class III-fold pyridoxal phosphate-dependent enzyme [Elusimicrobiota bacterium]